MSVRLLPFNAKPEKFKQHTKQKFVLNSIQDLCLRLKHSKGVEGKPVRLLVKGENVLVTKYGIGDDKSRDGCIEDELRNFRILQDFKIEQYTPHVVDLIWGYQNKQEKSCLMCLEYVVPVKNMGTLRDLVKSGCDDSVWRHALFQIIYTLISLNTLFPGFKHNDLKADNILITTPPVHSLSYAINTKNCKSLSVPLQIRRTWILSPPLVWVKIIDFEISSQTHQEDFKGPMLSSSIMNNPGELKDIYGLTMSPSSVFDIHLMAYDVLDNAPEGKMKNEFFSFITEFIPSKYFLKENLTTTFRLNVEDQLKLEKEISKHVLLEMLSHSYFFFLRGDPHECVKYEINYCK